MIILLRKLFLVSAVASLITSAPLPTLSQASWNTPTKKLSSPAVYYCEGKNFTEPCFYKQAPLGTCITYTQLTASTNGPTCLLYGDRWLDFPGCRNETGTITSFGPDADVVCRTYKQPYCRGGFGSSNQVTYPGLSSMDRGLSSYPVKSWKCVNTAAFSYYGNRVWEIDIEITDFEDRAMIEQAAGAGWGPNSPATDVPQNVRCGR